MITGSCGSREQLMSYIQRNYRRRYRATYTLTDYNLFLAIEAYHYGVLNGTGIDRATSEICRTYRCSYKRLSNFLRELRLWDADANDWVLPVCEKTINSEYSPKKPRKARTEESWNLTLDIPHPFLFKVRPLNENDPAAELIVRDIGMMLERGAPELAEEMQITRVEEEPTEFTKLSREVVRVRRKQRLVTIEWSLSWNDKWEYSSVEYGELEEEDWVVWRM